MVQKLQHDTIRTGVFGPKLTPSTRIRIQIRMFLNEPNPNAHLSSKIHFGCPTQSSETTFTLFEKGNFYLIYFPLGHLPIVQQLWRKHTLVLPGCCKIRQPSCGEEYVNSRKRNSANNSPMKAFQIRSKTCTVYRACTSDWS